MTRNEVEEIKGHFDHAIGTLRGEMGTLRGEMGTLRGEMGTLRGEMGTVREELRTEFRTELQAVRTEVAEVRRHAGVVAEDLRSEIRLVADGVALANERINQVDLRVDGLTGEMRRGFAGVRAEMHSLHETDDELRRRIEAQKQRDASR